LLQVDHVSLRENTATARHARRHLRFEAQIGELLDRVAEPAGLFVEERTRSGGATRVHREITD
jgi:hypothetical protein